MSRLLFDMLSEVERRKLDAFFDVQRPKTVARDRPAQTPPKFENVGAYVRDRTEIPEILYAVFPEWKLRMAKRTGIVVTQVHPYTVNTCLDHSLRYELVDEPRPCVVEIDAPAVFDLGFQFIRARSNRYARHTTINFWKIYPPHNMDEAWWPPNVLRARTRFDPHFRPFSDL